MVSDRKDKLTPADIIVPPLLAIYPNSKLPTILRSSSLSLLSTCAEVDHLALVPWMRELVDAALDLVQIESVASSPFRPAPVPVEATARPRIVLIEDEEEEDAEERRQVEATPRIVDNEPTDVGDSKHPALRRSAIVFLGLLVASLIESRVEGDSERDTPGIKITAAMPERTRARGDVPGIGKSGMERIRTVLGYVGATDVDEVVRAQAVEVVALVGRLGEVSIGVVW
jgi:hypothetical protein